MPRVHDGRRSVDSDRGGQSVCSSRTISATRAGIVDSDVAIVLGLKQEEPLRGLGFMAAWRSQHHNFDSTDVTTLGVQLVRQVDLFQKYRYIAPVHLMDSLNERF